MAHKTAAGYSYSKTLCLNCLGGCTWSCDGHCRETEAGHILCRPSPGAASMPAFTPGWVQTWEQRKAWVEMSWGCAWVSASYQSSRNTSVEFTRTKCDLLLELSLGGVWNACVCWMWWTLASLPIRLTLCWRKLPFSLFVVLRFMAPRDRDSCLPLLSCAPWELHPTSPNFASGQQVLAGSPCQDCCMYQHAFCIAQTSPFSSAHS